MAETAPATASTKGFSHIAFRVENVDDTYERALAHGAGALGRITQKRIKGVGVLTFVYLRDPEGNIIEIQSWD